MLDVVGYKHIAHRGLPLTAWYVSVVEIAPSITRPEGTGSQFVRSTGTTAVLPCDAYGIPQPTITWYKDR